VGSVRCVYETGATERSYISLGIGLRINLLRDFCGGVHSLGIAQMPNGFADSIEGASGVDGEH
ncbi:hypothetical protein Q7F05_26925, partial [Pseudomonas sp. Lb2C1-1]|uniref:hypothetical protein n=1 Tax=Pseudomonas TaxID=286 RepID=UPI00398E42D3